MLIFFLVPVGQTLALTNNKYSSFRRPGWLQGSTNIIPGLKRLRKGNGKSEASLGYKKVCHKNNQANNNKPVRHNSTRYGSTYPLLAICQI